MALVETDAYLLRAYGFGETSRIAVLFGREAGKLRVISKGYRNPKNPCAGALEPFRQIHLVYYHRPSREIQIAAQADVVRHHDRIEEDVARYFYASAALELVNLLMPDDQPEVALFDLLYRTLEVLGRVSGARAAIVFRGFQARTCAMAGFLPELQSCTVCEGEVQANRLFSAGAGGFVCGSCADSGTAVETISPESAALFRFLLIADPHDVAKSYEPAVRPAALEVARLIERFIAAHVDRYAGLKSMKTLQRLLQGSGRKEGNRNGR